MVNGKLIVGENFNDSKQNKQLEILSPVNNEVLGSVQLANRDQVDEAFIICKKVFKSWKDTPVYEKYELFKKISDEILNRKEELAELLSKEIAKTYKDSIVEVERSAEFILTTAEFGRTLGGDLRNGDVMKGYKKNAKLGLVNFEPRGTILCISPFNYPINLSVSKIAPALIGGNCVVFKPATQGSLSGFLLAQIFNKYLPQGVLKFITGNSSEIGDYMLEHDEVDMINFTGSTQVGNKIKKISKVPYLLELGGKDFAIVTKNAEVNKTVSQIIKGAFSYSGQRCTAIKTVLVDSEVYDEVMKVLLLELKKIKVGNPKEDVMVTPLINLQAADYAEELVKDAESKGGKLTWQFYRKGNLVAPQLVEVTDLETRLLWEEQFSPVLPIYKYENLDNAIEIINNSQYGLQADVFTQDVDEAFHIANQLEVGSIQINGKSDRGPDNFPFLGVKNSGSGTQGIVESIKAMMKEKVIVLNL